MTVPGGTTVSGDQHLMRGPTPGLQDAGAITCGSSSGNRATGLPDRDRTQPNDPLPRLTVSCAFATFRGQPAPPTPAPNASVARKKSWAARCLCSRGRSAEARPHPPLPDGGCTASSQSRSSIPPGYNAVARYLAGPVQIDSKPRRSQSRDRGAYRMRLPVELLLDLGHSCNVAAR